jgi:hypothetical protein
MNWFIKQLTLERIAIYLGLISAAIGGLWAFNTRYCALLHADEVLNKDVCAITTRVVELEQRDKKIDKIYDYVVKHRSN